MSNEKSKLTYVITGGCGFLGQHLLSVLLEKEENIKEIRLFDKNVYPSLQSHSTGKKHVKQTVHYNDYELVSAQSVIVEHYDRCCVLCSYPAYHDATCVFCKRLDVITRCFFNTFHTWTNLFNLQSTFKSQRMLFLSGF